MTAKQSESDVHREGSRCPMEHVGAYGHTPLLTQEIPFLDRIDRMIRINKTRPVLLVDVIIHSELDGGRWLLMSPKVCCQELPPDSS